MDRKVVLMGITATFRRRQRFLAACIAAFWGVLLVPQALGDRDEKQGFDDGDGQRAVYVQTNTAPVNYVMAFDRSSDGTLTPAGRFATGEAGKPAGTRRSGSRSSTARARSR